MIWSKFSSIYYCQVLVWPVHVPKRYKQWTHTHTKFTFHLPSYHQKKNKRYDQINIIIFPVSYTINRKLTFRNSLHKIVNDIGKIPNNLNLACFEIFPGIGWLDIMVYYHWLLWSIIWLIMRDTLLVREWRWDFYFQTLIAHIDNRFISNLLFSLVSCESQRHKNLKWEENSQTRHILNLKY